MMDSNHRMPESKSGALPTWRIPNGRGSRVRTCDKRIKSPLLYQLSYTPKVVAADGFEPSTTALSALCSTPELCGYCTFSIIHFQYSSSVMIGSLFGLCCQRFVSFISRVYAVSTYITFWSGDNHISKLLSNTFYCFYLCGF